MRGADTRRGILAKHPCLLAMKGAASNLQAQMPILLNSAAGKGVYFIYNDLIRSQRFS